MAEKMPIRIREVAKAVGTTDQTVKTAIVPPGEIWCLQGMAYENETNTGGVFRRYIEGHGYNHYLAQHTPTAAAELIFTDQILYLLPGERLVIRQATCSISDVLALYIHGYKLHSAYIPRGE